MLIKNLTTIGRGAKGFATDRNMSRKEANFPGEEFPSWHILGAFKFSVSDCVVITSRRFVVVGFRTIGHLVQCAWETHIFTSDTYKITKMH